MWWIPQSAIQKSQLVLEELSDVKPSVSAFMNLPPALKIVFLGLGGGSLALVVRLLPRPYRLPLLIGLAVIVLILVLYSKLLKKLKKRKAAPLERGIADNASATPQAVTDAARRAALEDLRKSFQKGIDAFRAAGKNLYGMPWYMIVGEPGSGKTEAIRHSSIGFPPGLHDALQGAGGTINMNWWFTNHAVILDTAGRLIFEEVEHGAPSEWGEFLKLLESHRRNCPINGMLLVIPADSLIIDTADDIQRKGQKIAQQLDHIQRTLGVRFPVYVVITKCDLINGFREFFDTIDDPDLQHQMLGWSNPAPIDEQFQPDGVDQHLQSVVERIERRRLALLVDPVPAEDTEARRIDQVDALYAFPKSLTRIIPRLRRYLEMVFATGEWSPKPLFLRGIYFTSSMREGSALDEELAEVLGVPVASLPEGRVWERERSYFLRDLFVNKIFREKGLVTRAVNANRQHHRRRATVFGAGIVGAVLLFFWTLFGWLSLKNSVGVHQEHWETAKADWSYFFRNKEGSRHYWRPIVEQVEQDYSYNDPAIRNTKTTVTEFHSKTLNLVRYGEHPAPKRPPKEEKERIPDILWVFRMAGTVKNYREEIVTAQEKLYRLSVLRPLIDAARKKVQSGLPAEWTQDAAATQALGQLIRLEAQGQSPRPMEMSGEGFFSLDGLLDYALRPEDRTKVNQDNRQALSTSLNWIYTKGHGEQQWPPKGISLDGSYAEGKPLYDGVAAFNDYWKSRAKGGDGLLSKFLVLSEALEEYQQAETKFLAAVSRDELKGIESKVGVALRSPWIENPAGLGENEKPRYDSAYALKQAKESLDAALRLAAGPGLTLEDVLKNLQSQLKQPEGSPRPDLFGFKKIVADSVSAYGVLLREASVGSGVVAELRQALETARDNLTRDLETTDKRLADALDPEGGLLLRVGTRSLYEYHYDICMLTSAAQVAEDVKRLANNEDARRVGKTYQPLMWPEIPLTSVQARTFDQKYHPHAASDHFSNWRTFNQSHSARLSLSLSRRYADLKKDFEAYLGEYRGYWDPRKIDFPIRSGETWSSFHEETSKLVLLDVLRKVLELIEKHNAAFTSEMVEAAKSFGGQPLQTGFSEIQMQLILALERLKQDMQDALANRTLKFEMLKNWQALPKDAFAARSKLLEKPTDLARNYFPFTPTRTNPNPDLDTRYWADLAYAALYTLRGDPASVDGAAAVNEFASRYGRFPLVHLDSPLDAGKHLSPAEVDEARAALRALQEQGADAPRIFAERTDIDEMLSRLSQLRPRAEDQTWINKVERVLNGLPTMGNPQTCTGSIREEGFSNIFRYWDVGLERQGAIRTRRDGLSQRFDIPFPNEDLVVFRVYDRPGPDLQKDPPYYRLPISGPWAAILMVHNEKWPAERNKQPTTLLSTATRDDDGKTWTMMLFLPHERDAKAAATIELKFKLELPRIEDWPLPRAGRPLGLGQ